MARNYDPGRRFGRDFHDGLGDGPRNLQEALAAYGFVPEFGTLSICTTCWDLFDDPSLGERGREQQECRCRWSDQPHWPGYDFNERARLCDCCCRYVLRSGYRWSVWFCGVCKERVVSLNREVGFALIPIGRHSFMHGIGLRVDAEGSLIERFVNEVRGLMERTDLLQDEWKPARLRRELERLGLIVRGTPAPGGSARGVPGQGASAEEASPWSPASVPLVNYLGAVAEEDRRSSFGARQAVRGRSVVDRRLEAFRGLAHFFGAGEEA